MQGKGGGQGKGGLFTADEGITAMKGQRGLAGFASPARFES